MNKCLLLLFLTVGMLSSGVHNEAFATDTAQQTPEDQKSLLDLSIDELQKLVDAGDSSAQYCLAWKYYNGIDVEKDLKKAFSICREVDEHEGDARTRFLLAKMYQNGEGVKRNPEKAYKLYDSLSYDVPEAAYRAAKMIYDGENVPGYINDAIFHCWQAEEKGHTGAKFLLYKVDFKIGYRKTMQEVFKICQEAADHGYVEAQYFVGCIYDIKQDMEKALEWYKKAADKGYSKARNRLNLIEKANAGDVDAQFQLGKMYELDEGAGSNDAKAVEFYTKAANQGHIDAQARLGEIYRYGTCGECRDLKKSFEWYQKAADQGHVEAQYVVGSMYYEGKGVEKRNMEKALEWYQKAADQGHGKAARLSGWMHANLKHDEKALEYFKKAAEGNYSKKQ